mmetsp:Transcript_154053/g.295481  ORF Transcript_154053/g.295481 Transcript_154053/m.295481 type:complete len:232 (+) Transcript_154053:44-739(+)
MENGDGPEAFAATPPGSEPPLAVIFDMGGVLGPDTDYAPLWRRLPEGADKEKVKEVQKAAWKKGRETPSMAMEDYWKPILEAAGLPADSWKELDEEIASTFVAWWQVLGVVDQVRKAGLRVGILSNHLTSWFARWFERFGLSELFSDPKMVIVSADVRASKPGTDIYRQLLANSGLQAEACVFVDDKKENVEAAEKLGFRGVHFRHIGKDGSPCESAEALAKKLREQGVPV